MTSDPTVAHFLAPLHPPLTPADRSVFQYLLHQQRTPEYLIPLMRNRTKRVARAAILCLGLAGRMSHAAALVPLLADRDDTISAAAEHSLWTIWMRGGSARANRELAEAVSLIDRQEYAAADRKLRLLCTAAPGFAEARHQRGIALFSLDRFDGAAGQFRQTLRLNPWHFSAAASLGHTCILRGRLGDALKHYRAAQSINPRAKGLQEAIFRVETLAERAG